MASPRWSKEKAHAWYGKLPWLVGCNFIPSSAINQLEMFQKETFDPVTINRELGWAGKVGLNTVRVYLHDLLWENKKEEFKKNIDKFLSVAEKNRIKTLFVIFDDCWGTAPKTGKQKGRPGEVHNHGWVQSPGNAVTNSPKTWGRLEKYVKGLLKTFGRDERVIIWDLYNEPGNTSQREKSMPLLEKAFEWAKEADPAQPLTSGVWADFKALNSFQLNSSDIITFHNYREPAHLLTEIKDLEALGRPVICTEYLARGQGSFFKPSLEIFKKYKVGCYNWGLVDGKTQTKFAWGTPSGAPEPELWHHEIFRKNGQPYDREETAYIKKLTKNKKIF